MYLDPKKCSLDPLCENLLLSPEVCILKALVLILFSMLTQDFNAAMYSFGIVHEAL